MAALKDKIQNALDESRTLVLGVQVLLGFLYESVLEKEYEKMPVSSHYLLVGTLGLLLIALALLMVPVTYHHLVARGEDTEDLHSFTVKAIGVALLPFACSLGLNVYIIITKAVSATVGIVSGVATAATALFFWYGIEAMHYLGRGALFQAEGTEGSKMKPQDEGKSLVKDKIRHVLTEARLVLPGAQALLGFQFIAVLMEGFNQLAPHAKTVHLISLGLIALSTILLMTPAAYHRLVENGEETEDFYRFASRLVLAAMVPLALGICGDFFVVVLKVTASEGIALVAAAIALLFFFGLWFGYSFYRRSQLAEQPPASSGLTSSAAL